MMQGLSVIRQSRLDYNKGSFTYGRKSVDRMATQSMSKICNLWSLIVVDCDYAESYEQFLSGETADASCAVNIVPDDSRPRSQIWNWIKISNGLGVMTI